MNADATPVAVIGDEQSWVKNQPLVHMHREGHVAQMILKPESLPEPYVNQYLSAGEMVLFTCMQPERNFAFGDAFKYRYSPVG